MYAAENRRIVITTVETDAQAAVLARELVNSRLAACVTCTGGRSYFRWESDTVNDQAEIVLIIKTDAEKIAEIEQHFASHHPYNCPELITLKMDQIGDAYGHWFATELDRE